MEEKKKKIRDPKVALMRVNGKTRYIVSKAADRSKGDSRDSSKYN